MSKDKKRMNLPRHTAHTFIVTQLGGELFEFFLVFVLHSQQPGFGLFKTLSHLRLQDMGLIELLGRIFKHAQDLINS
jgi:hypothetical protein